MYDAEAIMVLYAIVCMEDCSDETEGVIFAELGAWFWKDEEVLWRDLTEGLEIWTQQQN